jgi:hypothetical protein
MPATARCCCGVLSLARSRIKTGLIFRCRHRQAGYISRPLSAWPCHDLDRGHGMNLPGCCSPVSWPPWRCVFRFALVLESRPAELPGRPGDFHPESPTDPDVNLSIHPARATPRKPAGFRQDQEFLRLPVDSILTWVTCPLCSAGITPLLRSYEAVRP